MTIVPYQNAFIAKRDFFMLEVQKVGDVLTWVPVKTYDQVLLGTLERGPCQAWAGNAEGLFAGGFTREREAPRPSGLFTG